jgi:hypothetical protein
MAGFVAKNLVAGLGVSFDGNLVGHGPGWNKKGLLETKIAGHLGLKPVDGWIFRHHVVSHFGPGHCIPHCAAWFCDSVATQINDFEGIGLHDGHPLFSLAKDRSLAQKIK